VYSLADPTTDRETGEQHLRLGGHVGGELKLPAKNQADDCAREQDRGLRPDEPDCVGDEGLGHWVSPCVLDNFVLA
jgi:hypothetical protein